MPCSLVLPGEVALEIAGQHPPRPGLLAVLGRVEPCQTIFMRGKKGLLEPRIEAGKCLHYYHYYWDEDFGLRYTRLQTWFPFTMHIGINGRDWLGQQLLKAGIAHTKKDNCFTWIEDFAAAQRLADASLIIEQHPVALQLRYLQTLSEVAAENNSTTLFPVPIDLLSPFLSAAKKTTT